MFDYGYVTPIGWMVKNIEIELLQRFVEIILQISWTLTLWFPFSLFFLKFKLKWYFFKRRCYFWKFMLMKKLKIEAIEVQSFVTQLNQNHWQTVKGGQPAAGETFLPRCTIDRPGCPGEQNTKYPICQVAWKRLSDEVLTIFSRTILAPYLIYLRQFVDS